MDNKKRKAKRIDEPKKKVVVKEKRETNPLNVDGFDEKSLGINPLLNNLEIFVNTLTLPNQYRRDGEDLVANEVDFDRQESTRLFISPVNRKVTLGLNYSELRLFVWLAYESNRGKDYLWINSKRFLQESGMSINTYKSALEKLCRYCYIYPTVGLKDVYWTNPAIFFNGDRVRRFPKNVKKYVPANGGSKV